MIFPITQMGIARRSGSFKRDAARRPPLHSRMGRREIMKTTTSFDTCCPSVLVKSVTRESIKILYTFNLLTTYPAWLVLTANCRYNLTFMQPGPAPWSSVPPVPAFTVLGNPVSPERPGFPVLPGLPMLPVLPERPELQRPTLMHPTVLSHSEVLHNY